MRQLFTHPSLVTRHFSRLLAVAVFCLLLTATAAAQKATIKGTVLDKASGEAIAFANVRIEGTDRGAATDDQGFFAIPNLEIGKYNVLSSYLGFETQTVEVEITKKNQTVSIKIELAVRAKELKEAEISAERTKQVTESRVSVVSITPLDMKRVPSIGGEADIAQYLQVLPGVVSTGDQGGQIVIRGGTPIQTKFLLDGITIFNPFHSIGLFSIYETDIIKNVEVYTGGFPAEYGGRISAVVDVTTRDGNRKKFSGKVSGSPFMSKLLLEIPVIKAREDRKSSASLILNTKVSYLDQTSRYLYPYTDKFTGTSGQKGLPYAFYDAYGKFSVSMGGGNKFSLSGFNFRDVAKFDAADYLWNSFGVGANFVAVPKNSNIYFTTRFSYSKYSIRLQEQGYGPRTSSIGGFDIGMDFTNFIKNGDLKYGLEVSGNRTEFAFSNQFGQSISQDQNTTDFSVYGNFHKFLKRFVIELGFRMQYYGNLSAVSPEGRLSMKVNATDRVRFKVATGNYSQNFISTKSDRDVVNLFNGFLTGPEGDLTDRSGNVLKRNMQQSVHVIGGVEADLPKNITLNVEGYYKYFWNLINLNRFKQQVQDPNFIAEKGDAYGVDFLAKWEYKGVFLYATYSLAWTNRNDGIAKYPPHFDRRHNVNLIGSYSFGKNRSWEVNARWNFGSGFPFTKTQNFYEQLPFSGGIGTDYTQNNGALGIVYDNNINGGRLPYYHRLDFGAKKIFSLPKDVKIEINLSVSNVYNRQNIFYFDRVRYTKVYQLPVLPSLALAVNW